MKQLKCLRGWLGAKSMLQKSYKEGIMFTWMAWCERLNTDSLGKRQRKQRNVYVDDLARIASPCSYEDSQSERADGGRADDKMP